MTNMLVKFHFEIPCYCWENCKKNLRVILFCFTLYMRWKYTVIQKYVAEWL